jgi:hypothetical protein
VDCTVAIVCKHIPPAGVQGTTHKVRVLSSVLITNVFRLRFQMTFPPNPFN